PARIELAVPSVAARRPVVVYAYGRDRGWEALPSRRLDGGRRVSATISVLASYYAVGMVGAGVAEELVDAAVEAPGGAVGGPLVETFESRVGEWADRDRPARADVAVEPRSAGETDHCL